MEPVSQCTGCENTNRNRGSTVSDMAECHFFFWAGELGISLSWVVLGGLVLEQDRLGYEEFFFFFGFFLNCI